MVEVVVRAQFSYELGDSGERWPVAKGDTGVLRWKSHARHSRYLEPLVVWDNDPFRRERRAILSSLTTVGLQASGLRVMVTFPTV